MTGSYSAENVCASVGSVLIQQRFVNKVFIPFGGTSGYKFAQEAGKKKLGTYNH
jgi:hypothetical protein